MIFHLKGVLSIFPEEYGLISVTLIKQLPNKPKICAEFPFNSPTL